MATQQFTTPHPIRLALTVPAGRLHVTTGDGDQSTVTLEGAQKAVEAMRVALVGDRLVVELRRKAFVSFFDRADDSLAIQAHVPRGSSVEIVTAAADAMLEGSFNDLHMKSASGGVRVSGEVAGDAALKTVSGDVLLPRVGGDLEVRSVSGDVAADSVAGSVSAKSVSGNVRVGSLRQGQVSVQSVSGDVDLGIAAGTSIDVDAGSASGSLSSEVPLADAPAAGSGPTVVIRSNTVSGDFHVFRAA
jgi:DUF4097 and DUF4098 domain-containing protein YvlB